MIFFNKNYRRPNLLFHCYWLIMNKNIHTCFRSTININEREPVQDFVKDTLLSLFTQNEKKKISYGDL